ncbi:hypothetical protein [Methanoregula sp.]|uniref:hypothetical protein n=1 Tax=Methanoregula sp. TaxID=2052170 RepID=UPI003FD8E4E9
MTAGVQSPGTGMTMFHRGAVISWGRSIGIPDGVALAFMREEGVVIIDDRRQAPVGVGHVTRTDA